MEKTKIYELTPTDSRKSFYGKAKVIVIGDRHYLRSYDTIMGCIDTKTGKAHRYSDYYSSTTNRHIRAFFADPKGFWNLPLEKCPALTVTL